MAKAAPKVRQLAKELGVDLDTIVPSRDNGYVSVEEVEAAAGLISEERLEAMGAKVPLTDTEISSIGKTIKDAHVNTRTRDTGERRAKLNHNTDDDMEAGGMRFKRPDSGALDHSTSKRLDIPKKYLNNELHYHWAIDDGGRIEQMRERLGYAEVPNIEADNGDTITTRRRTGTNKDGTPQFQQLMATPNSFYAERKMKAEEARTFKEQGIIDTPTDDKGKPLNESEFYMAQGSSIGRK